MSCRGVRTLFLSSVTIIKWRRKTALHVSETMPDKEGNDAEASQDTRNTGRPLYVFVG